MAKAWEVPGLRRDATFRDAAGRVIITRWRELESYRAGTLAGEDIEELHAMRVSSRRLRAAMDAFAEAFPRRGFRRYLSTVKEITDTLGDARDLDVAIDALASIADEFTPQEQVGIRTLIDASAAQRAGETAHIAALMTRLEDERFGHRFERWLRRHTGVDADRLAPRGPGD